MAAKNTSAFFVLEHGKILAVWRDEGKRLIHSLSFAEGA